jgi:hypothetical protein
MRGTRRVGGLPDRLNLIGWASRSHLRSMCSYVHYYKVGCPFHAPPLPEKGGEPDPNRRLRCGYN